MNGRGQPPVELSNRRRLTWKDFGLTETQWEGEGRRRGLRSNRGVRLSDDIQLPF